MVTSHPWQLDIPWWELVLRGSVVYAFLLILLRITGKRQVGQLAPFDLVLLLVLSNAVQNAMNGGDASILGGLVSAGTLVALNSLVSWVTYRSKTAEALIEGRPLLLIHNGAVLETHMAWARVTHHELNAALRQAGFTRVNDVHTAVLENNGVISVTGWNNHHEPGEGHEGGTGPRPSPPSPGAGPTPTGGRRV